MDQFPRPVSDNVPHEAETIMPSFSAGRSVIERFRKPTSVVFVALIVCLLWWSAGTASPAWRLLETVFGFALAAAAAFGRVWCAIYISGRKNDELCTMGPYSLCRNPLYLFSSLGLYGIVLTSHRPVCALLAFAVFWGYYWGVIRNEELRLACLFGSSYDDYRARIPAIWPRIRGYVDDVSIIINLRLVQRAFGEVAWFLAAWLVAHLVFGTR